MKLSRDIQTISELKQNTSKLVKQVRETGRPIVLTLNGKPAVVIQDVESYERMAEAADYELTIRALNEALVDFDNRQDWPTHDAVFSEFRKKNKIK